MKYVEKILIPVTFVLANLYVSCVFANDTHNLPIYSQSYDPNRDPFADLVMATETAEKNNRLVLLIVGGYWCSWCHTLDRYLERNDEFTDLFYLTFEVVKIYYGPKNKNLMFLSKLPQIKGYPHFFIMDANFELLGKQDSGKLEKKKRFPLSSEHYQDKHMQDFLNKWVNYLQTSHDKILQPIRDTGS